MSSVIYDLEAAKLGGATEKLSQFEGKVLLIVNTASHCGFTPQFDGLEELYQRYHEQGFEILGFPCNQFGQQEPGDAEATLAVCKKNYGVSFPMFDKIEVNGDGAHPLFKHLRSERSGILGDRIKWNFTKFLVNREGKVVDRFAPTTKPESLKSSIEKLL